MGEVIQLLDGLEGREADLLTEFGLPMQVTYGYASANARSPAPRPVPEVLKGALRRNRDGAIIVSTGKIQRLTHIGFEVDKPGGFDALREVFCYFQMRRLPPVRVGINLLRNMPWLMRAIWWRFVPIRFEAGSQCGHRTETSG